MPARQNRRILRILRLLPPPSKFRSRRYAAQAKFARKRFLLWEMGFPDAKISTVPDARGDFADFPNRQNRSALADLKTLWVFNLPVGVDFYARGLRLSRALPGVGLTGCPAEILLRGVVAFDTPPGSDFTARGLRPSRSPLVFDRRKRSAPLIRAERFVCTGRFPAASPPRKAEAKLPSMAESHAAASASLSASSSQSRTLDTPRL